MTWKYQRCNPGDCCKDARYGDGVAGAKATDKGRQITPASSTTCTKATTKATQTCKCAYVLHYTKYIADGNPIRKKADTGWIVLEEKLHGYTDGAWDANFDKWSDEEEAKFKAEQKALDPTGKEKAIRLELICLAVDSAGDPVAVPEPK